MALVVTYVGGEYELVVENQGSVALVQDGVTVLADAMSQGVDAVVNAAEFIFEAGNQLTRVEIESIFSASTELMLEAEVIFVADEGLTLLDALVAAGEALAAALL